MRMSSESYSRMNALATKCFDANALVDNLAYNLEYNYYPNIAKVVHLNVAHVLPLWADVVTDEMLLLGARPTRQPINGYDAEYKLPAENFSALRVLMEDIREEVRSLIESADLAGDDEVRIFGEEFLVRVSPFLKQAEEWETVAARMDPHTLDVHIDQYTSFIPH